MAETPERDPSVEQEPLSQAPDQKGECLPLLRQWLKWTLLTVTGLLVAVGLICSIIIAYANIAPVWISCGLIEDEVQKVERFKVALVFGTTPRIDGRENLYFRYRIDAAEQLWKAGKVETIIVSGDNRTRYYNEPLMMRQALVDRGIPDERIVSDYAGLRTLDSVVRAKKIFGTNKLLFVSQPFHIRRAIYLAKAHGIEARGFAARDVKNAPGFKTKMREVGARVKMWLDVHFLDTQPRHLGDKEQMPE